MCNIIEYRSKNETVERNFYESRILNLGLCFYPGDIAHLFFLIFQRHSGDVGDRIREGTCYSTVGALIVGVPIGLLCAMFMASFCPKRLYSVLKPAIDLMAGIPSIVYGFFGILVIVPAVHNLFGTSGKGLLTASLLLGMMILPTIIGVCETQIRSVPEQYYEGSLALGATHERSVFFVLLPAAKSGVLAGIILGIGRAIGETMAVIMIAGNQPIIPESITSGVRTMTANIVLEMGYAEGLHKEALIATGVVLFVFILIINLSFSALKGKK